MWARISNGHYITTVKIDDSYTEMRNTVMVWIPTPSGTYPTRILKSQIMEYYDEHTSLLMDIVHAEH